MAQKHYPCDDEPFICPFDAQGGDACRCYCGLGVDETSVDDDYVENENDLDD